MSDSTTPRLERFVTRRTARCALRGPTDPADAKELWIVLHGYGTLAADFLKGFGAIDDGTRLFVAPEALSRFYDATSATDKHAEARVGASWMTREDRLEEIADQRHWLQQVHDHYRALVGPAVPLTVLAFSQGAAAASRWLAHGHSTAARLICWGASIAPELPVGPDTPLGRTSCTIVIGDRDKFVSAHVVATERERLSAAGFRGTFERFEGGHRLDDATLRRLAGPAR